MDDVRFEKFVGDNVSEAMIEEAAGLFSSQYGVWAAEHTKPASRIRMSSSRLRQECIPQEAVGNIIHARLLLGERVIGHLFACHWGRTGTDSVVCWITQLVVHANYRSRGLATRLLEGIREERFTHYGILSSHAHACMAAVNAFAGGLGGVSMDLIRQAPNCMKNSPVPYVRNAKVHGVLFGDGESSTISSADTQFSVDHAEPVWALKALQERHGLTWPLGQLPAGHEFLMFVQAGKSWQSV